MPLTQIALDGLLPGTNGSQGYFPELTAIPSGGVITLTGTAAYVGDVPAAGLELNPGVPSDVDLTHRFWLKYQIRDGSGPIKLNINQALPTEFVPVTSMWAVGIIHAVWLVDAWWIIHGAGLDRIEHYMAPEGAELPLLVHRDGTSGDITTAKSFRTGALNQTRRQGLRDAGVMLQVAPSSLGIAQLPGGRYRGVSGAAAWVPETKSILLTTAADSTQRTTVFNAAATAMGV